jgi:hypothetical protein
MEAFDTEIRLKDEFVKIFVVPFDIPEGETTAGYLLVLNDLTLGSIRMNSDGHWVTEDALPWNDEDLQIIGDNIGYHSSFIDIS